MLLKEEKLNDFAVWKTFIAANNQEKRTRFHLLTAKTHADTFMNLFPTLFAL